MLRAIATSADPASFWAWFSRRHADLRAVMREDMTGDEPVLDDLLAALQAVDPELWFLLGGDAEGTLELVITAEGNDAAFPAVESVVAAAPTTPEWSIIAFKPAMGFDFEVKHEAARIDGKTAGFQPMSTEEGEFAVRIACDGYVDAADDDFAYAAEMLLDSGLGELVAREIRGVDVVRTPSSPKTKGFLPLRELAEYMAFRRSKAAT
jgi:hypothetical protein